MKKLPASQFYFGDWKKDAELSMCSLSTRGFWFEILGAMHELGRSGQITGTVQQLARVGRCAAAEAEEAIAELKLTKAADISERNGVFTIINRRMKREFEMREANKSYVRNHREKQNVRNSKTNVRNNENAVNNEEYGEYETCKTNVRSYSSSSSSNTVFPNGKNSKENGSGGGLPAPVREKPPPTAAVNRQWIELTAAEQKMSKIAFAEHLQKLYPTRDVKHIAKKLKIFCDNNGKDFVLERLKGWVVGEGATLTKTEFLEAFGEDEKENKKSISDLVAEKYGDKNGT